MSDLSGMTLPGAVPAGREIALHEPSFETAIAAIVADPDLPADVKNHWPCSLRRLATFLGRPMALVPARWSAVRIPASHLKATRLGVTQKTLANHFSNVRAALAWMHQEKRVPARGMRLSREWEVLRDKCPKFPHRTRLYSLMRYCSARKYPLSAVDEAVIDSFLDYRRCTISLAADAAARRSLARHWNDLVRTGPRWPSKLLFEPPSRKAEAIPPWEAYPIGLRYEIKTYLGKSHAGPQDSQGQAGATGQGDHDPGPPCLARSGAQDGDPDRHRHGGIGLSRRLSRSRRQPAGP